MKKVILLTAVITYILCVQNSQQAESSFRYFRPTLITRERGCDNDLIWMIALYECGPCEKARNIVAIKEDASCLVGELARYISFTCTEQIIQYIQYAILQQGKSR